MPESLMNTNKFDSIDSKKLRNFFVQKVNHLLYSVQGSITYSSQVRDNVKRRCIVSSFCPVASLRVQREREEEQINTLPLAVTFTPSIHQLLLHSTGFLHHPRRCRKELFTRRNHLPFPGPYWSKKNPTCLANETAKTGYCPHRM